MLTLLAGCWNPMVPSLSPSSLSCFSFFFLSSSNWCCWRDLRRLTHSRIVCFHLGCKGQGLSSSFWKSSYGFPFLPFCPRSIVAIVSSSIRFLTKLRCPLSVRESLLRFWLLSLWRGKQSHSCSSWSAHASIMSRNATTERGLFLPKSQYSCCSARPLWKQSITSSSVYWQWWRGYRKISLCMFSGLHLARVCIVVSHGEWLGDELSLESCR